MADAADNTRRGMLLGAMALPVTPLDSVLTALIEQHRRAWMRLEVLCEVPEVAECAGGHPLFLSASAHEATCRRALLAHVPETLAEVRAVAGYLAGRIKPISCCDFEDRRMIETYVLALAEIEVAA